MKNQARLQYKGERFMVWQDSNSNWCFTYKNLQDINTGHKELQPALNGIYESVDDVLSPPYKRRKQQKQQKPVHKKGETLLDRLGI